MDKLPETFSDLGRRRRRFVPAWLGDWLPETIRLPGWLSFTLALTAVLFGLSVLWVGLYAAIEAPGTILMAQRSMEGVNVQRTTKRLSRISPHLVRAVIAAEDSRFCAHDGFDREAIDAALAYNRKQAAKGSDRRRGASTISQQTAKNLFLWPQRSWVRKGAEVYFTFLIEGAWSKRRIMEAYLNAAEWGNGVFGAEEAAWRYFGRSAADLTPTQAARLAAVLPSPNKWSPDKPGPYVRRRAAAIEARMRAVRAQNLAACVLGEEDGARAPARKRKAPETLPELPPPPPSEAEDLDSAVGADSAAETDSAPEDGAMEAPAPGAPLIPDPQTAAPATGEPVDPTPLNPEPGSAAPDPALRGTAPPEPAPESDPPAPTP